MFKISWENFPKYEAKLELFPFFELRISIMKIILFVLWKKKRDEGWLWVCSGK